MKPELRVFVYGTLKKGFSNHDRYCAGVLSIFPACRRGRLFVLSENVPAMTVPEEDILLYGTASAASDIEAQERFKSVLRRKGETRPASTVGAEWRTVQGELLAFDDAEIRLPLLDSLEEFQPGQESLYKRALVYVSLPGGEQTSAWTYIAGFDPVSLEEYAAENWDPALDACKTQPQGGRGRKVFLSQR